MANELQHEKRLEQVMLFGGTDRHNVSIDDAAAQLCVSSATVRNWIKTGYLSAAGNGTVYADSISAFFHEHAGKEKLIGRANKSHKDSHDHSDVTAHFTSKLLDDAIDHDLIGDEYQTALSDSYKNKEGIYYTPRTIVNDMLKSPGDDLSSRVFCDPCCGSGNFIARALEVGFKPENIIGYDTDPVAVEITKRRILHITGYNSDTIYNADFLENAIRHGTTFDYIFTNPPWGKKLSKDKKDFFGSIFGADKGTDTCSLFFFACLKCLSNDGQLGLLLPEAFFNIAAYEKARRTALSFTLDRLIDYEKPFKGLMTRAQAIVLTKRQSRDTKRDFQCEFNGHVLKRNSTSFQNNPKAIFNFKCTLDESAVIDHAYSLQHISLEGRARWGLGIVTGNNDRHIVHKPTEGYIPVLKGSDIKRNELTAPSCYIPFDFTLYQQVAPLHLYRSKEKLIYRFISSELCFFADSDQRFFLNSANMLIPDSTFPLSCTQLASLLNSRFMNWLFRTIFNTHKILRGDLESLPIHSDYFVKHPVFDENSYLDYLSIEGSENGTYRLKK